MRPTPTTAIKSLSNDQDQNTDCRVFLLIYIYVAVTHEIEYIVDFEEGMEADMKDLGLKNAKLIQFSN